MSTDSSIPSSSASSGRSLEEAVPAAALDALIEKGRASGRLSADDLVKELEWVELNASLIEQLMQRLSAEGIELAEDFEVAAPAEPIVTSASPVGFTGSVTDPVRAYLQAIGTIPLLKPDQERRLAERVEAGQKAAARLTELSYFVPPPPDAELAPLRQAVREGLDARRRLVEANLRLVVSVAKRYRHRGVGFLDLIQEGNAGLVRAVEKFDVGRGFKLSTYATWWIRQAMSRAVADQARTIRIPVHVYETLGRVLRVQRAMLQEHGREPSVEELADRVQLPAQRVQEILSLDRSTVSLEPQGDEPGLGDLIADSKVEMPADVVDRHALRQSLQEALADLGERERELMRLRFGLDDGQTRSLEEVGRSFGVTRERVRQIETKTLAKLRLPLARHQIEDFLRDD